MPIFFSRPGRLEQDEMMDDERQPDSTDLIGELIRQGGRRESPSADEHDRVFAAATNAFQAKVRRRRRSVMLRSIAAVMLVGIVTAVVVMNLPPAALQPLAEVDRVVGPSEVQRGSVQRGSVQRGDETWIALTGEPFPLFAASRIRTGPGSRLGVRMANGVSLRLAESTDVVFTAPDRIRLLTGKVYADAGKTSTTDGAAVRRIMVETDVGLVWDIGTQFEVRYVNRIYRLRVREGLVYLQHDLGDVDLQAHDLPNGRRELRGSAGEQLTIDAARRVRKDRIASDDSEWRWTESVAPEPVIDARPVSVLLAWVARQTGRSVAYARPALEFEAETTFLYGRVYHLEPLEALDTFLETTDFEYTLLEDGTILIDSKR